MREILFRGQRTDNREWLYGYYFFEDNNLFSGIKGCHYIHPKGENQAFSVMPETVGQYTGLTDKNGTKIFEGDICRNTRTGEIVSVKWHGTMAGFVWSKRQEKSHLFNFGELFRAHDKYEVIGNIQDTPEKEKGQG